MPEPPPSNTAEAAQSSGADSSAWDRPVRLRPAIIMVAVAGLLMLAVVVLLQIFVAERIPELTEARLEAAQQRWKERGPASYDMEVEIRGNQPGDVRIAVRDGEPTSLTRNGYSPKRRTWEAWVVPSLFALLERELAMAEDPEQEVGAAAGTQWRLRCEFDPEFGFPCRFHRHAVGGGPELYWRVTRFEPR